MLRGNLVHSVSLNFIEAVSTFPTHQPHTAPFFQHTSSSVSHFLSNHTLSSTTAHTNMHTQMVREHLAVEQVSHAQPNHLPSKDYLHIAVWTFVQSHVQNDENLPPAHAPIIKLNTF